MQANDIEHPSMDILQDTNANVLHQLRREARDATRYSPKEADIFIDLLCSFFGRSEVHEQAIKDRRVIAGEVLCERLLASMQTNLLSRYQHVDSLQAHTAWTHSQTEQDGGARLLA